MVEIETGVSRKQLTAQFPSIFVLIVQCFY